jgi:hypothetical protein
MGNCKFLYTFIIKWQLQNSQVILGGLGEVLTQTLLACVVGTMHGIVPMARGDGAWTDWYVGRVPAVAAGLLGFVLTKVIASVTRKLGISSKPFTQQENTVCYPRR